MQESSGEATDNIEFAHCRERAKEDPDTECQYSVVQKCYGCSKKDCFEQGVSSYCRVATIYEEKTCTYHHQSTRNSNQPTPTFSSPPHSPLVGLIFEPSTSLNTRKLMAERSNSDRRSSNWSFSHLEPIGTGAKKKIVKSQDKRSAYGSDPRFNERIKDPGDIERQKRQDRHFLSESTSSLDFYVEGEKMVSDLCAIPDSHETCSIPRRSCNQDDDRSKSSGPSEIFLTALDKIVIHDQIPNQIVQLAIEACTDAENIAIAHHNRPCFKNIHSICAKTRSNVQKPDSAVANLHSQGIPWVIKNFIFSFVRILDGWKGVKELLSEKHDTFSRIENKYYSENIRECFVQWQAVTKEMLTHIYKTFKCLDHGFTLEQKSFTHNYYATNSAAPRHQSQNKFQPAKPHCNIPRPVSSPQPYNALQPPWVQNQMTNTSQNFHEAQWQNKSSNYKKIPVVSSSQNYYSVNDPVEYDMFQKPQHKCDPSSYREAKPRQSWTITNVADFRALESIYQAEQRELYTQLKHKMDAELGKAPGQPIFNNMPCDILQRREMELKAKMIPLSHVEKTLIPSMAASSDIRGCYMPKNNSCGDTKEDMDFFATWGQMIQKERNDILSHHTHSVHVPSNVLTISNNIAGPVNFFEHEHDECYEISKVYMKPGSYKVPIKPSDPISQFTPSSQDNVFDNMDDNSSVNAKTSYPTVVLAPQPKYNIESWPCLISKRAEDTDKDIRITATPCIDIPASDPINILSSMTSDKAWEAAKQSAPKLMDFIHDDTKSDTARLYDALGLSDHGSESLKQVKSSIKEDDDCFGGNSNVCMSKSTPKNWDESSSKDNPTQPNQNEIIENTSHAYKIESDKKDPSEISDNQMKEPKPSRCHNFDQCGNNIKDVSLKKSAKPKVAVPGMWYHPKKKKPLPMATVKKFESIISTISENDETAFIQRDMDIKIAPRFYEVVKYPMCLHDISTKLNNSSYTDQEQVVQDFRRIFNNVRLYIKSCPDATMKKSINKVSAEFEKLLNEEFHTKLDSKSQSGEEKDTGKKTKGKNADMHNDVKN